MAADTLSGMACQQSPEKVPDYIDQEERRCLHQGCEYAGQRSQKQRKLQQTEKQYDAKDNPFVRAW